MCLFAPLISYDTLPLITKSCFLVQALTVGETAFGSATSFVTLSFRLMARIILVHEPLERPRCIAVNALIRTSTSFVSLMKLLLLLGQWSRGGATIFCMICVSTNLLLGSGLINIGLCVSVDIRR